MDRLKIIGDDIEIDGRLVARIVAPEGSLRDLFTPLVETEARLRLGASNWYTPPASYRREKPKAKKPS